jgi:hypothetical protein
MVGIIATSCKTQHSTNGAYKHKLDNKVMKGVAVKQKII